MVSRKRPTHPRIFPDVLQAISDLRDMNGSTIRKIIEQVQSAIGSSKNPRKPRNIVMQVQRALKHGVLSGVLKQKAGKYKLTFGADLFNNPIPDYNVPTTNYSRRKKCKPPPRGKKCVPPNRRRNRKNSRRRRSSRQLLIGKSSSEVATSRDRMRESRSRSGSCKPSSGSSRISVDHHDSSIRISGRPKRAVWGISKTKKIDRPRRRCKKPTGVGGLKKVERPKRLARRKSPEPMDANAENLSDDNEEEPKDKGEEKVNFQQGLVPYNDYSQEQDVGAPECDNPDCLCNIKQEPDDDNNFENTRPPFM